MAILLNYSIHFSDNQKLGFSIPVYTDKNIPKGITLFLAKLLIEEMTIRRPPIASGEVHTVVAYFWLTVPPPQTPIKMKDIQL